MSEELTTPIFVKLGGEFHHGFPFFESKPSFTKNGITYLTKPGVVMLARPTFEPDMIQGFLSGFSSELLFDSYLNDAPIEEEGTALVKVAGQLCYMSFGPGRSMNDDVQKYVDNIKSSGHGSVLEHAQYTFLIYGVDRGFTHELVRHRSGCAFSQVSQRYVSGKTLRFVERPEWQKDGNMHLMFVDRIDESARQYDALANMLISRQKEGDAQLVGEKKTEMRKKVNQAARSCLPNETEAPIIFSANIRALRHICEMRASGAADVPIREVTTRILLCMKEVEPALFSDYKLGELPDGTYAAETPWRKV